VSSSEDLTKITLLTVTLIENKPVSGILSTDRRLCPDLYPRAFLANGGRSPALTPVHSPERAAWPCPPFLVGIRPEPPPPPPRRETGPAPHPDRAIRATAPVARTGRREDIRLGKVWLEDQAGQSRQTLVAANLRRLITAYSGILARSAIRYCARRQRSNRYRIGSGARKARSAILIRLNRSTYIVDVENITKPHRSCRQTLRSGHSCVKPFQNGRLQTNSGFQQVVIVRKSYDHYQLT
jgi:hypothetical protein